jgi:hypothetical protein
MNKGIITLCMLLAFCATSVFANPQIQTKHKALKKDGVQITCAYCHTTGKVEKKKGYPVANINANASCKGPGCHPVKK